MCSVFGVDEWDWLLILYCLAKRNFSDGWYIYNRLLHRKRLAFMPPEDNFWKKFMKKMSNFQSDIWQKRRHFHFPQCYAIISTLMNQVIQLFEDAIYSGKPEIAVLMLMMIALFIWQISSKKSLSNCLYPMLFSETYQYFLRSIKTRLH